MNRASCPPAAPGFCWAKWRVAAEGTAEADDTTPSDRWEPVEVFAKRPGSDVSAYVEALKRCASVETDEELAAAIGVTRAALADWRKRGHVPADTEAQLRKRFGRQAALANFDRSAPAPLDRWSSAHGKPVLAAFVPGVAAPQSLDNFVWGSAVR